MVEDDVLVRLQALHIPPASDDAVARILSKAKESPRRMLPGIGLLRQFRAAIYIPSMRYVIMASVVGFFILVGMIFDPEPTASLQEEFAQNVADETGLTALSDLLYDVDVDDEEGWEKDMLADNEEDDNLL